MGKDYIVYDSNIPIPDFALVKHENGVYWHGQWGLTAASIMFKTNGQQLRYHSSDKHVEDRFSSASGVVAILPDNYTKKDIDTMLETFKNDNPEYYI